MTAYEFRDAGIFYATRGRLDGIWGFAPQLPTIFENNLDQATKTQFECIVSDYRRGYAEGVRAQKGGK